ncbi:hypothetical protein F5Y14DRAFT_233299 [Nemania sp. NC0429]|nr:hypothetical protein F5Y14DRAFT_233299 [Nemania sp. NC0429]
MLSRPKEALCFTASHFWLLLGTTAGSARCTLARPVQVGVTDIGMAMRQDWITAIFLDRIISICSGSRMSIPMSILAGSPSTRVISRTKLATAGWPSLTPLKRKGTTAYSEVVWCSSAMPRMTIGVDRRLTWRVGHCAKAHARSANVRVQPVSPQTDSSRSVTDETIRYNFRYVRGLEVYPVPMSGLESTEDGMIGMCDLAVIRSTCRISWVERRGPSDVAGEVTDVTRGAINVAT